MLWEPTATLNHFLFLRLPFFFSHSSPHRRCSLGGDLLLCDGCNQSFHIDCLGFDECPEEETWFCDDCVEERAPRSINPSIQTFDDFIRLISQAQNILVISGAGISVTAGIPDFRSEMGLYRMLRHIDLGLTQEDFDGGFCSEDLFGMDFFRKNPRPFYRFFQTMVTKTNSVDPTPMHYFLKELQNRGKLLRVFTQNIDMLEQKVGLDEDKVVACHGSAEKFACLCCKATVSGTAIIEKMVLEASLSQESTQETQTESRDKKSFYVPKCSEFIPSSLPPYSPTASGMGFLTASLQQSHITSPPPSFGPSPCSACVGRFRKKFRNASLAHAASGHGGHFSGFGDFSDDSDDSGVEDGGAHRHHVDDGNVPCQGVLKPDIIFFGEQLPEKVFTKIAEDTRACDLVLVMGTSMKVSPVAAFPSLIPKRVPLLNINRDWVELRPHIGHFDAQFQGSSDTFALKAAQSLGWELSFAPKTEPFPSTRPLLDQEEQPSSPWQNQTLSREDVGLNAVKDFYSGVVPNWVLNSMDNCEIPNTLHDIAIANSNLTLASGVSTNTQDTTHDEETITHAQTSIKSEEEKDDSRLNEHHHSEVEFGLFLQFLRENRGVVTENLDQYAAGDIESLLKEFCRPADPSTALRLHIDLYRESILELAKQKQQETLTLRKKALQDGNQENSNSHSATVTATLGSVNADIRVRSTENSEGEEKVQRLDDQNRQDHQQQASFVILSDIKRVRKE